MSKFIKFHNEECKEVMVNTSLIESVVEVAGQVYVFMVGSCDETMYFVTKFKTVGELIQAFGLEVRDATGSSNLRLP